MVMSLNKKLVRVLIMICLMFWLLSLDTATSFGNEKKQTYVMTESELQFQLMSFADRFSSVILQGIGHYGASTPSIENFEIVKSHIVYAAASAFTIAAKPDPDVALLDMVAMVTLGRMVLEEHWVKELGSQVESIVIVFQKAEQNIWGLASKVLNKNQQQTLFTIISEWRKNHPQMLFFSYFRLSDFDTKRGTMLLKEKKTSGLFKSVELATQQVEEVRLMTERSIYLGSRLPLLAGGFVDVWLSQLLLKPGPKSVLADFHKLIEVSDRLAIVAEELPDRFAEERKRTIEDFLNEEQRMRGLLSEVQLTLAEGNKLLGSADSLVKGLNLGPGKVNSASPVQPFDIIDYQVTLKEASNTIVHLNELVRLLNQMGLEKMLPQIIKTVETIEKEGEKWVYFAFILSIALIVVFLIGAIIASLLYRYFANKIFESRPQQTNRFDSVKNSDDEMKPLSSKILGRDVEDISC